MKSTQTPVRLARALRPNRIAPRIIALDELFAATDLSSQRARRARARAEWIIAAPTLGIRARDERRQQIDVQLDWRIGFHVVGFGVVSRSDARLEELVVIWPVDPARVGPALDTLVHDAGERVEAVLFL